MTACLHDSVSFDRLELVEKLESEQLAEIAEWQIDHLLGVRDGAHGAANLHRGILDICYVYLSFVEIATCARAPPVDRPLIRHKLLLIHVLSLTAAPAEE